MIVEEEVKSYRKAAEVHREARSYIQSKIKPGCEALRRLLRPGGPHPPHHWREWPQRRHGFPTGCSLNHCAAHYTPNPGDDTVLKESDVMKFDFGTEVNGDAIGWK